MRMGPRFATVGQPASLQRLGMARAPVVASGPRNYVTNGTFTGNDATGWSGTALGGGFATITGDKVVINNTSGLTKNLIYTFPVAPANGTVCTFSMDVSGFVTNGGGTSQSINVCGFSTAGPLIAGAGPYSTPATAGSGTTLNITVRSGMNLSIDNVQVVG